MHLKVFDSQEFLSPTKRALIFVDFLYTGASVIIPLLCNEQTSMNNEILHIGDKIIEIHKGEKIAMQNICNFRYAKRY